jgi:hypothetical protein
VKARIVDAEHNNAYKLMKEGGQFRAQLMLYKYYKDKLLSKRT